MRVVIAGGSGMIGRHLARAMLADGWYVDILTRDPEGTAARVPAGVRSIAWTPAQPTGLEMLLEGADRVVNLAGVSLGPRPWTRARKRAILDSRLAATESIVAALGMLPPDRRPPVLVSASGSDVYTGRDADPAVESTEPSHDFLADVCLRWEAAAGGAEDLGVRVALVRTAFVLAPDAPVLRLLALPFRLFVGGRLGSGSQWFSWIHIDDLVGIYRLALSDQSIVGPINAASPEPCRQVDLAAALGRALHRPSWLPAPAWALRLVLRDQATLLIGSRRVSPALALLAGYRFKHPAVDEALRSVLG